MWFTELPESVYLCLSLIWGIFRNYFLKCMFCTSIFSLSFLESNEYHNLWVSAHFISIFFSSLLMWLDVTQSVFIISILLLSPSSELLNIWYCIFDLWNFHLTFKIIYISLLRTSVFPFISTASTFTPPSPMEDGCNTFFKIFIWQLQYLGHLEVGTCWIFPYTSFQTFLVLDM